MTNFLIKVIVDPTNATVGARKVKGELRGIEGTAGSLAKTLTRVFAILGGGALLSRGIGLLAEYEQTMSTVRAITGATELQMRDLRQEAERLGATTRFSASQAGEGLIFLARAGFSAQEAISVLAPTLQLAQAGGLNLGRAADITTNILSAFRLEVNQTGRVVDVLALAANSANTDVGQLGKALSFVAPSAAGLGVSIEETAAAIGVLSDNGLQASRAGTGLLNILATLETPTSKAREVFARFGVAVDQVKPSTVGLTQALTVLRDAGLQAGEGLEVFGKRGGPAFEVLLNSIPRVRELNGELDEAGGTAERIAEIMDDNLNGALLATKSALEAVILAIGNAGATGALTGFFGVFATGLRGLADNIDTFIDVVETLGTALAIQFAAKAVPAAILAIKALGVAILANPIGVLTTALTLAIGAFVGFADRLSLGSGQVGNAMDFLISIVGIFAEKFGAAINFVTERFGGFQIEVDTFSFSDFVRGAAIGADSIIRIFTTAFRIVTNSAQNLAASVGETLANVLNALPGVDGFSARFESTGQTAAQIMDRALSAGVEGGFFFGVVEEGLARAGARGAARAAREAERAIATTGAAVTTPDDPTGSSGSGGGELAPGGADRTAILQQTIQALNEEAELLRIVGDERTVLQGILGVEEKLRSKLRSANQELSEEQINDLARLTEAERAALVELTRRNVSLERQGNILSDILGPAQEYSSQQEALNALLREGAISAGQFNAALQETALVQQLGAVTRESFGAFGQGREFELEQLQSLEQQKLDIVRQGLDQRIITEQEAAETIRAINRQTAAESLRINTSGFKTIAEQGEQSFGALADFVRQYGDDTSKVFKGLFAAQQAFALASAIVNTAQGVSLALATYPPPLNFIQAALVAAAGAAQVATITAQTVQAFADGGLVRAAGPVSGPGSSRSDSIPALLSNGEFVVNAQAASANRELLEDVNNGRFNPQTRQVEILQSVDRVVGQTPEDPPRAAENVQRFATGGFVSDGPVRRVNARPVRQTQRSEPTSREAPQRRGDNFSISFVLPDNADAESFQRSERQIEFRMKQMMDRISERNGA